MIMAYSKLGKKQDKNSLEKWQEGRRFDGGCILQG